MLLLDLRALSQQTFNSLPQTSNDACDTGRTHPAVKTQRALRGRTRLRRSRGAHAAPWQRALCACLHGQPRGCALAAAASRQGRGLRTRCAHSARSSTGMNACEASQAAVCSARAAPSSSACRLRVAPACFIATLSGCFLQSSDHGWWRAGRMMRLESASGRPWLAPTCCCDATAAHLCFGAGACALAVARVRQLPAPAPGRCNKS